jgi:hypothetical protein
MKLIVGLTMSAALCVGTAVAEEPGGPSNTLPIAATAPLASGMAPKNTLVVIRIGEPLSSKVVAVGDRFVIQLAEPITSAEGVLVPAGTTGAGEVISVSKAGAFAKAGELVLAARFLDLNGRHVPLKAFKLGAAGKDPTNGLITASIALSATPAGLPFSIVSMAIPGGQAEIQAGALATAKLAEDLTAPIQPAAAPESASISPSTNQ